MADDHKYCIQEKEIGQMVAILAGIVKEFYGNGSVGISKTVPVLQSQIASLTEATAGQATAISALAKAVTEFTTIDKYKDKASNRRRDILKIIISVILGVSSIAVALIIKLL